MTRIHSGLSCRQPRVTGRLPAGDGVQVGGVQGEPPAELARVPDMPVAGHYLADAGYGRQPLHPGAVVAERIRRDGVEQRYLHVGAHVSGDQDTALRQEHRAVTGRMPVVHDQPGLRTVPRDGGSVQCSHPPDQGQVVTGHGPLDPVDDVVPLGLGDGDGGRRGVPGRVPEFPAPQHVIPVRVGRPADRGPQPSRGQLGGQSGQVGRCHGRVDDQAASGGAGHDRARGHRVGTGRDEHPGRDLRQAPHRTGIPPAGLAGHADAGDGRGGEAPVRPGHRPSAVLEHRVGVELAEALDQPGHQAGPPGLM